MQIFMKKTEEGEKKNENKFLNQLFCTSGNHKIRKSNIFVIFLEMKEIDDNLSMQNKHEAYVNDEKHI